MINIRFINSDSMESSLNTTEFYSEYEKGEVHLVVETLLDGMTNYNTLVSAFLPPEQRLELGMKIIEKKETGTFYPAKYLTAVPLLKDNDANYTRFALDCFEANENYIKCKTMVFDFRGSAAADNFIWVCTDNARQYEFKYLKEIIFLT